MRLKSTKWHKGSPTVDNFHSAYRELDYLEAKSFQRREAYLKKRHDNFVCPECKGKCGWTEAVLDYGQGPWFACGTCLGQGVVTNYEFLLYLKHDKALEAKIGACV